MEIPKKIIENIEYDNEYRKVVIKKFQIKNGKNHDLIITGQKGINISTMVIPITEDGKIIYEKEFRYGIEDFVYNFPVGSLEENLGEIENVKKELKEETGYSSNEIEYLGETIVGYYDDGIVKYYIARNCKKGKQNLEDGEYIEIIEESIEDFKKNIKSGKINCPLTLSCWLLGKDKI